MFCSLPKKSSKEICHMARECEQEIPSEVCSHKKRHIYSEHFRLDMFEEGGERVILKSYAVPTIFSHPKVCVYVPSYFIYH